MTPFQLEHHIFCPENFGVLCWVHCWDYIPTSVWVLSEEISHEMKLWKLNVYFRKPLSTDVCVVQRVLYPEISLTLVCCSWIVEYHGRHNHFVKERQIVHNQDLSAWTKRVKAKRSLTATSSTDPRISGSCLWGPELLIKIFLSQHKVYVL